jgi:hypothetical protein
MPSIIPPYIYTLFASILVGVIIIAAVGVSAAELKSVAEEQQLNNLAQYVATKSLELISQTNTGNINVTTKLDLPSTIGNQQYWITLTNSSSRTWVQAGIGINEASSAYQSTIPAQAQTEGVYRSIQGQASLECIKNSSGLYLRIYGVT